MCHKALRILLLGLPVGRVHGPHHHLRDDTYMSTALKISWHHRWLDFFFFKELFYSSNTMFKRTDNELAVAACDEHGCILFLGSLWPFGRHGFSWWGSEGNRQVAGVLGGSSRTRQSCGCGRGDGGATTIWYVRGGTVAHSNLLRGHFSGHNVDHWLLVALHAGTKLKESANFTYCNLMRHSSKKDNKDTLHEVDGRYIDVMHITGNPNMMCQH